MCVGVCVCVGVLRKTEAVLHPTVPQPRHIHNPPSIQTRMKAGLPKKASDRKQQFFIWETGESGDIHMLQNKS